MSKAVHLVFYQEFSDDEREDGRFLCEVLDYFLKKASHSVYKTQS